MYAHKNILCARSSVFFKTFSLDMLEKSSSEIYLDDENYEVFITFLEFLYTNL